MKEKENPFGILITLLILFLLISCLFFYGLIKFREVEEINGEIRYIQIETLNLLKQDLETSLSEDWQNCISYNKEGELLWNISCFDGCETIPYSEDNWNITCSLIKHCPNKK